MKQPCDVNQPIKVLYQQIEDAIEFAAAGQNPFSPKQVLNIAYQLIFCTGIFSDDCKIWKCQTTAYTTWPQFKLDFAVAYQEYSETLDITPAASDFDAKEATDLQETIDAIANLATATDEDRKAVANLTGANATLTKELATSNGKLLMALTLVPTLKNKNRRPTSWQQSPHPNRSTKRKHYYCWTCRYRCEHSRSNTCQSFRHDEWIHQEQTLTSSGNKQ
jgi:hypothetical protein